MSRLVKDIKLDMRKLVNRFNKFQDEIDELRWELASTRIPERAHELREVIEKREKYFWKKIK